MQNLSKYFSPEKRLIFSYDKNATGNYKTFKLIFVCTLKNKISIMLILIMLLHLENFFRAN